MRNRTEMVTNKIEGSDYDEADDFEDSEEDWQPEKGDVSVCIRKVRVFNGGYFSLTRSRF
jgi:hypothetical protein